MKKFSLVISLSFLVLIIFVFSFPSICFSEYKIPDPNVWKYFITTTGGDYYYDKINITKSSNIISVSIYHSVMEGEKKDMIEIVKKGNLEQSIKYQTLNHVIEVVEIDCMNRKFRMIEWKSYDVNGNILDYDKFYNKIWESIEPHDIFVKLYNKVCVTPNKPSKNK
jgi:hypothetical protein